MEILIRPFYILSHIFTAPTSLGPDRHHHFSHDVFSTQQASDWISTVRLIRPDSNYRHSDVSILMKLAIELIRL